MRVLIIGNRFHQLLTNYVEALKTADSTCVVDVLSYESNAKAYSTDGLFDKIYTLKVIGGTILPKYLRIFIQQIKLRFLLKKINDKYDIIHIHYLENYLQRDAAFLAKLITPKLVLTFWGSDFLRAKKWQIDKMKHWIDRADAITFATLEMREIFYQKFDREEYNPKTFILKFGLKPIDYIEKGELKIKYKAKFNISNDKIVISIGHNASRLQNHLEIMTLIEQNIGIQEYSDSLLFVLMLTYPCDSAYINKIKSFVKKSKFKYLLVENYLTDQEIAAYRMMSDYFIQLQPTDVLSGSMLEYLCAGNIVITGAWLPYDILKADNVRFYEVNAISDISMKLLELLRNHETIKHDVEGNYFLIKDKYQWSNMIKDWIKAYKNEK